MNLIPANNWIGKVFDKKYAIRESELNNYLEIYQPNKETPSIKVYIVSDVWELKKKIIESIIDFNSNQIKEELLKKLNYEREQEILNKF